MTETRTEMINATKLSDAKFAQICERKEKLESLLEKHHAKVLRWQGQLDDQNAYYSREIRDAFKLSNPGRAVQITRESIRVTSDLSIELIKGLEVDVPEGASALDLDSVNLLPAMNVLQEYLMRTEHIRRNTINASVSYTKAYAGLAELTLYEPVSRHEDAEQAIIYVTHPHDPLLHRYVQNFHLAQLAGSGKSRIPNRPFGRLRRWQLSREGKREDADIYLVYNPSLKVAGKDIADYARYKLQSRFDRDNPEIAQVRRGIQEELFTQQCSRESVALVPVPDLVRNVDPVDAVARAMRTPEYRARQEQFRINAWRKIDDLPN